MRQPVFFLLFISVFILLTDFYTYRGISALMQNMALRPRLALLITFWTLTILTLVWLIWFSISFKKFSYQETYRNISLFFGFFVLLYVPKLFFNVFQIVHDITLLISKGIAYLSPSDPVSGEGIRKITRYEFLLQAGLIIAAIPFLSIIWGIWKGRYNFKVSNVRLGFTNLPDSFNGTRVLQISDFHIGSFAGNPEMVKKAVDLINEQDPDYIVFTGDLVNNIASEVDEFVPILSQIKARYGKYSILGNHDYGEYYNWSSADELARNMENLYERHKDSGFTLLRNKSVLLEKNGESIAILGVENWGLPPFPQYGDLSATLKPVKDVPFKILLSHDPSH